MTYCKYVLKTSCRRLQEVLEDEKCYAEDVLKTSWKTRNVCWDIYAMFSVWVQVLEVAAKGAMIRKFASFSLAYMFKELIEIIFKENHAKVCCSSFVRARP